MSEADFGGIPHWPATSQVSRDEIRGLILNGKAVSAISLYRSIHGIGLTEAKQEIDMLMSAMFDQTKDHDRPHGR